MLALPEKGVELAGTEPVELFQRVEHRRTDDEGASPTPADGSNAASLPRAPDEEPVEVKVPLVQQGTHLRSRSTKRQANRRHSLVAL